MEEEFDTAFANSWPSREEKPWCFEKGNEELAIDIGLGR
jgi:hypothetical protein